MDACVDDPLPCDTDETLPNDDPDDRVELLEDDVVLDELAVPEEVLSDEVLSDDVLAAVGDEDEVALEADEPDDVDALSADVVDASAS